MGMEQQEIQKVIDRLVAGDYEQQESAGCKQVIVSFEIERECLRCGDCCRYIPLLRGIKGVLRHCIKEADKDFIRKHWHQIAAPKEHINRHSRYIYGNWQWFECDMLDKQRNLCKCYDKRPDICRNYPTEETRPGDLISDKCGFMPEGMRTNG